MTAETPIHARKVPLAAVRFAADVALDRTLASKDKVPVTVTARTGQPAFHWFWGRVVHDLAGMQVQKASVPLDYCHDCEDVVGYADTFDVATGDLVVSGALIPFAEGDRASEIAFKARSGVPYEASIFFDPDEIVLEEVAAGVAVQVNGVPVTGPVTIFRQWRLRGVALCPYGADAGTEVQFRDRAPEVTVRTLTRSKETVMSVETKPAPVDKPAEKPADKPAESAAAPKIEEKPVDKPAEKPAAGGEAGKEGQPPATGALGVAPAGKKFLDAFGDKGGVWFAEGRSFEQAQVLFSQHQAAEVDRLKKENAELAAKVKLAAGETQPVEFSPAPTVAQQQVQKLAQKVGSENLARFAAALKVPGH